MADFEKIEHTLTSARIHLDTKYGPGYSEKNPVEVFLFAFSALLYDREVSLSKKISAIQNNTDNEILDVLNNTTKPIYREIAKQFKVHHSKVIRIAERNGLKKKQNK